VDDHDRRAISRRQWRDNPGGQIRTIEEAMQLAEQYGVVIPNDIEFHVDESGELNSDVTARGPRVDKPTGKPVYWSDLVHDRTHKVPFRIWAGILKSDEAIVAVIAHEMYEIRGLRSYLESGEITIDDYVMHTEPGRIGNLHDQAWDEADRLVDLMRGVSRS
jgi:hypothetical protein